MLFRYFIWFVWSDTVAAIFSVEFVIDLWKQKLEKIEDTPQYYEIRHYWIIATFTKKLANLINSDEGFEQK